MSEDFCTVCGKPESEHHDFVSGLDRLEKHRQPGCVCKVHDKWLPHKPICKKYKEEFFSNIGACKYCEHIEGCHK